MTAPGVEAPLAVEWDVATDMVRRGLPVAPVLVLLGALGWGVHGALSVAFALLVTLGNLLVSAQLSGWAAKRSFGVLAGVTMGGFAVRMAVVALAVWAVKGQPWVELTPMAVAILVSQLGLLWWETRHLSISLAYPGLKPPTGRS